MKIKCVLMLIASAVAVVSATRDPPYGTNLVSTDK
jgi:hypothetical protein